MQKIAHFRYRGLIRSLTNLRIGGSEESLGIQTAENVVIRNPMTLKPYLPGSSIKGRMRCLLERELGICTSDQPTGAKVIFQDSVEIDNPVARLFGVHGLPTADIGPTRLMFHDATCVKGGEVFSKTQNVVGRQRGTSMNLFTYEFVPPDSEFELTFALQVFDLDQNFKYSRDLFDANAAKDPCSIRGKPIGNAPDWIKSLKDCKTTGAEAMEKLVLHGIDLLGQCGIGSGTSRGYGKIEIIGLTRLKPPQRSKFSDAGVSA